MDGETDTQRMSVELVPVADLKPHPRNYRTHTDEQLAHLIESLQRHGVYRNVVIAKDGTLLAGHGVVLAATRMGLTEIPVKRLDVEPDDPAALQVLAGDNEVAALAGVDDAALALILRDVREHANTLLGTGYSDEMLENLMIVTGAGGYEPVPPTNPNAEWVGMPEFAQDDQMPIKQLIVSFASEEHVRAFARLIEQDVTMTTKSVWYPAVQRVSNVGIGYVSDEDAA